MSLGPVMVDLRGTVLEENEREILTHPLVGGIILFSRNYKDPQQLASLIADIHALRTPPLLVAVDHEGGRVQRFRQGFTRLPAARRFGEIHEHDPRRARQLAEQAGWVMASELRAVGVDFSFAPVLDLDYGISEVIGDRAFHRRPQVVAELASAMMLGMQRAGMAATGKHFPGHGAVEADSHEAIPVDRREVEAILHEDVVPYERMIANGMAAVMPAHVIYSEVDEQPAGFSSFWLREVLRKRLGFQGIIFSDDLNMEGASVAGDYVARARAALDAGCDMVLICNNPEAARSILDGLD
ncbi:MAG: beta-N-acetylhexosaminidase, partial [Gammaproteobacteria bacterium]|nr:beta-N-acetylhexosaminidase [Gammaproteobacteria bacterium]MCW8841101.1 beta-N-acetylhexosaminidase [Gammaproteobacteria bacterium]MCW8958213.1 beta-N-acetylhexosaminidase [Gammaproteobacteria bacterium]